MPKTLRHPSLVGLRKADRDPTNLDRANRAAHTLALYSEELGGQPDEADLRDLLCDLMHMTMKFPDRYQSFGAALASAQATFICEVDPAEIAATVLTTPNDKVRA